MADLGTGVLLLLGFGIAVAESGLGIGSLIPGETVIVVVAAAMPAWPLTLALATLVAIGACLGDHVGYLLGRRYGHRLRRTRLVQRLGVDRYDRAIDTLHRRGAGAVFWTRLVPVVRVLTPAAAGVSKLHYRSFLPASLAGSAVWSAVYVGGGSAIGRVGALVVDLLGDLAWPVAIVAASIALAVGLVRVVPWLRSMTRHHSARPVTR